MSLKDRITELHAQRPTTAASTRLRTKMTVDTKLAPMILDAVEGAEPGQWDVIPNAIISAAPTKSGEPSVIFAVKREMPSATINLYNSGTLYGDGIDVRPFVEAAIASTATKRKKSA